MDKQKYQQDVRCDEVRTMNEETHKMNPSNVDKDYVAGCVKINFTSNLEVKDKEREVNPWGEKRGTHCKLNEETRSAYNGEVSDMKNQFDNSMSLTQGNLPGSGEEILLSSERDLQDEEREKEEDISEMNQMSRTHVTCTGEHINAPIPERQRSCDRKCIDLPPMEKVQEEKNPHHGGTSRGNINMNNSGDERRGDLDGAHISVKREQYGNKVSTILGTWSNREVSGNDQVFCTRGVPKEGAHLREAIRVPGIGADDTADEEAEKECTMVQGGGNSPHGKEEQEEQTKTNPIIQQGLNEVRRNNCMNRSGSYVDNGEEHNIYEESYVGSSNLRKNLLSEGHLDGEERREDAFPGDDSDWVSILNMGGTPPKVEGSSLNSCPFIKDIFHLRKNPHVGEKTRKVSSEEKKEKWTAKAPNGGSPKLPEQVRQIDNQLGIANGEIENFGEDKLKGYPSGEGQKTNVGEADLTEGPNGGVSHEGGSPFPCDVSIGIISSAKMEAPAEGGENEAISYNGVENKRVAHMEDGNEERFSCEERAVVSLDRAPPSAPPLRESIQERIEMGSVIRIDALVEGTATEEEGKIKDSSPEMCKVSLDVSNELDNNSRGNPVSPCRASENRFTSQDVLTQDVLSKSKYSTENQSISLIPRTFVSLGYTPDAHGITFTASRTRFGERKGIHMVDAKWSEGDKYILDNYQRSENIPMGTYGSGPKEIVPHRNDDYSSFEKEMNSVLLDLHKEGVNMNQDNFTHFTDCSKKKKRTGIPLNERKYYRVLAKQMMKIQGLTFDHNQIRWIAYWKNENNKQIQKHFPVCKYGFYKARQLALEFRNSKFASSSQTVGSEAVPIQGVSISEVDKPGMNPPQSSRKNSHKKDVETPKFLDPTQKGSQTTETRTKNKRKDAKVGIHNNPRKRSRISSRRVYLSEQIGGTVINPCHAEGTMKQENEPKNVEAKSNLTFVNKRINTCGGSAYGENSPIGRSTVGSFSGGGHAGMTRHDLKNVQNGDNFNSIQNSPHSSIAQGFPAFMGKHTTTDGQLPNRQEYSTGSYDSVNFYDQNAITLTGPYNNAWNSEHGRTSNYSYMANNFEAMQRGHNMAMSSFRIGLPGQVDYLNHGISGEVSPKGQFTNAYKNVSYQNPLNRSNQSNRVNPLFFGGKYGRNLQTVTDAGISHKWGGHTQIGNYINGSNFNNGHMKNEGGKTYSPRIRGLQSGLPQHMRSGTYQCSMNEGRTQNMGPHFNGVNKVVDSTWNSSCGGENGANVRDNSNVNSCVKNALEGKGVRSSAISRGSCVGGMGSEGIVNSAGAILEGDNPTQNKLKEDLNLNVHMHSRVSGERSERETWNLTRASTATHISEHLCELINVNRSLNYERSQGRSLPIEGVTSGEVVGMRNTGKETTRGKANILGDNDEMFGRRINSPEQWIRIQPMGKEKTTIKNACVESGGAGKMTYGHSVEGVTSAYVVDTTVGKEEGKTSERNVSGKNKEKKNNSSKRTNRKGEKSCNDSNMQGNGISLLSERDIVSRSCQWYVEEGSGEINQGGISNEGGVVKEVSKGGNRKKSAKRKKEKNELNVAHVSGKQNRTGCNQIDEAKNKRSEEVSSALSSSNKWMHSMSLIQRKANLSEEPKKGAMYEERNCTSGKQLDPCSQLNELTQNALFCVSPGESSAPKNGENVSEKVSDVLAKEETAATVEKDEEEMCTYRLNELEKNSCNDQDEDEYYYNEIMKMPKIKGVHFDIRQKRWCAYGHKKKECFSVYRYGFLIARELAVKSRLKVQKRKNNQKFKKNKNYMNGENVCGKNGVSAVKKGKTVRDKKTHCSDKWEISHVTYGGSDRNNNTVSLNDYDGPPSPVGSAECTSTPQFNDQKGDPMGGTPIGNTNSHENDTQNEVMDERIQHCNGTEMNPNLLPIVLAHSHETESLKGPTISGSMIRPYNGRGGSDTYTDNPYGGYYASPGRYANRSYTRRYYTGEVSSRRGNGTNNIVPLGNMAHHSEKDKNLSYPGNVNQVQEPFELYGTNEQIRLNGQVKSDNFYGAYNANGETNQMVHSNVERGTSNFVRMGNVERCVLRGPNEECQSYNGDVSWYNVARTNAGMQRMGSIPMGCVPVGPAPTLGNGPIKSNASNEEVRNRFHGIDLMNGGNFSNIREQVSGNEVMSTQGGFPLGVGGALPIDANKTCIPQIQQSNRTNNGTNTNGITDGSSEFVQNKEEVSILEPVVESKPERIRLKKDVVPSGYWSFINNWEKATTVGSDQSGGTDLTANGLTCLNSAPLINSGATPVGGGEFSTSCIPGGGRSGIANGAANRIDGRTNVGGHFLGISPSLQHKAPQNMLPQFPHANNTQGSFPHTLGTHPGGSFPSACDTTSRMNAKHWAIQKNREGQNDVGRVINMSETNFLQNDMKRAVVKNYSSVRSVEPFGAHNLMRSTTWGSRNVQGDCAKGKTNCRVGKEPHLQYDRNVAHIRSGYSEYDMNACVNVNGVSEKNEKCTTLARRNNGRDAFTSRLDDQGKNKTDKHLDENEKKFLHQIFQDNRNIGHIEVDIKNKPIESGLEKNKRLNFEEVNMFHEEVREPVVSGNTAGLTENEHRNERDSAEKWVQVNGKEVSHDRADVGKTDREATNKGVKIMKKEKKKKKEHIEFQSVNHIFHPLDVAHAKCEEEQTRSDKNKRSKSGFTHIRGSDETCAIEEGGAQTCLLPVCSLEGKEGAENELCGTEGTASNGSPIGVHMFKCHTSRSDAEERRSNFPLSQNKRSELICQDYDPYGGMEITTQEGSHGNIKSREEQRWDKLVFLKGTNRGGTENILCDDHGELACVDCSSTFSKTDGESPQSGIKGEQLKEHQLNPLEESKTVRPFENPYGSKKSGHYREEAAKGVVLKKVTISSAAPNCHLGRGTVEKVNTEDVRRFEADRMMAAAEVFLNRDYFDVCGDIPLAGDTMINGVVSEVPDGGHNEWRSKHYPKQDCKKGTILKNVHILKEYGERFSQRGSEEVPYVNALDGNKSGVDSLLDRYCLSIFGSIKISELMPIHCGGTEIEEVLFVEPYREYACLSLHDLNMNRAKDVNQTIHFKKLILKYLIMDLFRNISVPEFSKMTNNRTHFFVNPQKCASSYPLTNEVDKNRDLLKRVERYHLKFVANIYDMKFVQLYWDVFVTCLVKNVTASVLPFEEHCMVMRSLLLLYLESCA